MTRIGVVESGLLSLSMIIDGLARLQRGIKQVAIFVIIDIW